MAKLRIQVICNLTYCISFLPELGKIAHKYQSRFEPAVIWYRNTYYTRAILNQLFSLHIKTQIYFFNILVLLFYQCAYSPLPTFEFALVFLGLHVVKSNLIQYLIVIVLYINVRTLKQVHTLIVYKIYQLINKLFCLHMIFEKIS